jgi:RNA polymerase sigma factor (sigma-70 family)
MGAMGPRGGHGGTDRVPLPDRHEPFRKRYRRAVLALRKTVSEELRKDEFSTVEDRSIVAHALVELTPRQRAALVLTELIGFSSEEAGRMLGVSAGTVRALASQGRAAMKQHLEADDV